MKNLKRNLSISAVLTLIAISLAIFLNFTPQETYDIYNNPLGFYKISSKRLIPLLSQDYIPQGIHVTSYSNVYMSLYHKNRYGVSNKPSVITRYSLKEERLTAIYKLYKKDGSVFTGHVGGMMVYGDYFIVTYGRYFYFFHKKRVTSLGGNTYKSVYSHRIAPWLPDAKYNENGFSFANYSTDHLGKPMLWTGKFKTNGTYGMYILGYKISNGTISHSPTYKLYVPKRITKIQGVSILSKTANRYQLLLSQSAGDNPSLIYKLSYTYSSSKKRFIYDTSNPGHVVFKGPAGQQELHATKTGIWTLFESGANYYQDRAVYPWRDNFPYFIRIRKSDL